MQLQTVLRELLLLLLLLQTVIRELLLLLLLLLLVVGRRGRLELRRRVRRLRRRGHRVRRLLSGSRPPQQAAESLAVGHSQLSCRHQQQVAQRLVCLRSVDAALEVDDEPLGQVAPRGLRTQFFHEGIHS